MQNAELDEAQAGIKVPGRTVNNLRYADDNTLMAESEEELETLDESEQGEWKSLLKTQSTKNVDLGIWSHYFKVNNGATMETVTDFIFLDSKITADGDCSYEIKRRLLLGRKAMTNLVSILKSRDITLATKVRLSNLRFFQ